MRELSAKADFYPPDMKELGLAMCCILEQEGGCLTLQRVAEVLGDFLQIPEGILAIPHPHPNWDTTKWAYHLAWVCTDLRKHGFMVRNDSSTCGMCALTEHGHKLGQWAIQIYHGENPELPEWVVAFVQPVFKRMRRLLGGREHRRPPDYELCRWVRYCYLLNDPALGAGLFSLILADHVDPLLYRQAERQARILKLRTEEGAGGTPTKIAADNGEGPRHRQDECAKLRQWITDTCAPGTRIPTLVRSGYNEVRAITNEGVVVVSSRSERENLVPWANIAAAYRQLISKGAIDHGNVAGRGSFLCSLMAQLPGTKSVEGQCEVRLVDRSAIFTDASQS